jgi:L-ribulose-5-phosphate 4-epimerase
MRRKRGGHSVAFSGFCAVSEDVKFLCERLPPGAPLGHFDGFADLNACRRKLLRLRLIGVDATGAGFGNVSIRLGRNFYITGAATAKIAEIRSHDCAKVVAYDFEKNRIQYEGSAIPSSESLTHAAVYESDPSALAVIHCHNFKLWRALLQEAPATAPTAKYGTPEMAREVMHLLKRDDLKKQRIVVMSGHEGGLITFGKNLESAFDARIESYWGQTPFRVALREVKTGCATASAISSPGEASTLRSLELSYPPAERSGNRRS